MRVISWNVNSVRSRLPLLLQLIDKHEPDVVCLQETRCPVEEFPSAPLAALGYESVAVGHGGQHGVSISSRIGIEKIQRGFGGIPVAPFDEPRLLLATIGGVRVATAYAPNGKRVGAPEWRLKLAWFELLRHELQLEVSACDELDTPLLLVGDLNVCPTLDDVYDPVRKRNRNLVSEPERIAFEALVSLGLTDVARSIHGAEAGYTWYSFMHGQFANDRGYRLDVALASRLAMQRLERCRALTDWRDPLVVDRPSDHVPLLVQLST